MADEHVIDITPTEREQLGLRMLWIADDLKGDPIEFLTRGCSVPERPLWDENGAWVGDGVRVVSENTPVFQRVHENRVELRDNMSRAKVLCVLLPEDEAVVEAHSVQIVVER